MAAAPSLQIEAITAHEPLHVTLLELVEAVSDVTDNEREVVATVMHMLETGRVRLSVSFSGFPVRAFD